MNNELNGENLGLELNLCVQHPGRSTLVVLPDTDSVYQFADAFNDTYSSGDFKVSAAGIIFKNGSCIRIVTKETADSSLDDFIENGTYNCVLFEKSLIELEADISDLDSFMNGLCRKGNANE